MKRFDLLSTSMSAALCVSMLSGCATNAVFPDSSASSLESAVPLGSFGGSVYGGHAPVVGAHVFVLQATTGGYGNQAASLLPSVAAPANGSGGTAVKIESAATYGTQGMGYVTSDSAGGFNISGEYTCSPGLPVYLYATAGTSVIVPNSPLTLGSFTSSAATFQSNNLLSPGQIVTFQNVIGTNVTGTVDATALDLGTQYTVTAATPTAFTISGSFGALGNGGTTTGGTVAVASPENPAIGQLAMLGLCPSPTAANPTPAENFSKLSYIYMNEVSTIATAYAMSGFMSSSCTPANAPTTTAASASTCMSIPGEGGNPLTTGSQAGAPAWVGLQNATLNAAQIYDIQGGGGSSNTGNGEGHRANLNINDSRGNLVATVSQSMVHALANSLSNCVDSGNTTTKPANGTACKDLFKWALPSSSGAGGNISTSGTPTMSGSSPIETAAAAINLAHNPWNPDYNNILFADTNQNPPYTPTIASNGAQDLAVTITYPMTNAQPGNSLGMASSGLAIDQGGNAWVTGFNSFAVTKLSPQGTILWQDKSTLQAASGNGVTPGMVAIDSAGAGWVALRDTLGYNNTADGAFKFDSNGHVLTSTTNPPGYGQGLTTPAVQGLFDNIWVSIDKGDNPWFTNHVFNNTMEIVNSTSAVGTSLSYGVNPDLGKNNTASSTYNGPFANSIDSTGGLFMTTNAGQFNNITYFASASTVTPVVIGAQFDNSGNVPTPNPVVNDPTGIAIDNNNNAWVASNGTNDGTYTKNPVVNGHTLTVYESYYTDSLSIYKVGAGATSLTSYPTAASGKTGANFGLKNAMGVAVDGNGMVFFACPGISWNSHSNQRGSAPWSQSGGDIAVFNSGTSNFVTGAAGVTGNSTSATPLLAPYFMAVDNAGNLWVNTNTTVVEYMGMATPVLTPLSANFTGTGGLARKP